MNEPRVVDINPFLEGALLLALDELVSGHPETARSVLMMAHTTIVLYNRAKAIADAETLRRVSLAIEGTPW